jgi:hypothetical protein
MQYAVLLHQDRYTVLLDKRYILIIKVVSAHLQGKKEDNGGKQIKGKFNGFIQMDIAQAENDQRDHQDQIASADI